MAAGAVAAAAATAAAVVFGVSNGGMRDQLSQAQASSQQVAAVLTARDATMMTGAVRGGGTVTIVMSHSMRELVFTAAALHALPASRGYELWLIGPAGDRAVVAALFGPTFSARSWLAFDVGVIAPITGPQPRAIYAGVVYNIGQLWR